jgi:4-hydroxyphenylpyruvate dioxygenase
MRRAIATVCLSGTLEDKLEAAAAAGFDGVEIFEPDLIASKLRPAEVRERLGELGLTLDLYQPFRDFEGVSKPDFARAEAKFALMAELGAELLLVCSSVAPHAHDDDALAAAQLRELAERAQAHGIKIAYEALAWGRHVNDTRHAWRIVQRAGHPALGLCLDSFHMLSRGEDPATIQDIPGEKLFFLQLADAPRLAMDVLQWSRHHRCFPGQGGFDLPAFLGHVLAAGYKGPLSLEVFNDVFRATDPRRMAVDAMRSLLMLEGDVPPAAALDGYAFAEVAGEGIEPLLEGLGFARTGSHRTKPVSLWQQGAIRLVVNRGEEPRVAAVAVESADPARSVTRAERLLAPVLDRTRGPGEADISAVAAPDGTSVFFCGPDAGWVADFAPRAPAPAGPLHRIDHLALAQPFDAFDEAALFYRAVLALEPDGGEEVVTPDGLVRSRALNGGAVRLALNVPVLPLHDRAELQHVAFATADIKAAVRRAREAGVAMLEIGGNYYDDLEARLGVDTAELRELGLLYDRDAHGGGELLQAFTAAHGRVFFELMERRGGYAGYGAANTATRMAAQREEP